jgi:hypothetical protein
VSGGGHAGRGCTVQRLTGRASASGARLTSGSCVSRCASSNDMD